MVGDMDIAESKERGFTLLEILVTLAIVSLLVVFVSKTFLSHRKVYDVQGQVTDMVQRARGSLDLMTRETRMAGYNPRRASFSGIPYHTSLLVLLADLNGDGDVGDAEEGIIYHYDSGNSRLYRTTASGTEILVDHIRRFSFDHLKSDGSPAITSAEIRQVKILLEARTERPDGSFPDNGGYRTCSLTSMVTPKNLAFQ